MMRAIAGPARALTVRLGLCLALFAPVAARADSPFMMTDVRLWDLDGNDAIDALTIRFNAPVLESSVTALDPGAFHVSFGDLTAIGVGLHLEVLPDFLGGGHALHVTLSSELPITSSYGVVFWAGPEAEVIRTTTGAPLALPPAVPAPPVFPGGYIVIASVEVRDTDRNGAIDALTIRFTEPIEERSAWNVDPAAFRMSLGGLTAIGIRRHTETVQAENPFGWDILLHVAVSPELPTTSTNGLVFTAAPEAGVIWSKMGAPLRLPPLVPPPLVVDGAAPVLQEGSARDADGDRDLDVLELRFSEDITFAAGHGVWTSGVVLHPTLPEFAGTASVIVDGIPATVHVSLPYGLNIWADIADAFDTALASTFAELAHSLRADMRYAEADRVEATGRDASVTFDVASQRFLFKSGARAPAPSSFEIVSVSPELDALRLLASQGARRRDPGPVGAPEISDFFVLTPSGGRDLLAGITDEGVSVNGSVLSLRLAPGMDASDGTPVFLFLDDFDGTELTDLAGRELGSPFSNVEEDIIWKANWRELLAGRLLRIPDADEAQHDGWIVACGPPSRTRVSANLRPSVFPAEQIERVDVDLRSPEFVPAAPIEVLLPAGVSGDGFVDPPETIAGVGTSLLDADLEFVPPAAGVYPFTYRVVLRDEPIRTNLYTLIGHFAGLGTRQYVERPFRARVLDDVWAPTLTLERDAFRVVLGTASAPGEAVDVAAAGVLASDTCDAHPLVTHDGPAIFPPGLTPVTFTARDESGNSARAALTVHVVYDFGGFLPPVRADGSSLFNSGRTVPVKFQLRAADGTIVSNATARLDVLKVTDAVTGTLEELTPEGSGDSGQQFRFDPGAGAYVYNLDTRGLGAGTYLLRVSTSDATVHEVRVSVR